MVPLVCGNDSASLIPMETAMNITDCLNLQRGLPIGPGRDPIESNMAFSAFVSLPPSSSSSSSCSCVTPAAATAGSFPLMHLRSRYRTPESLHYLFSSAEKKIALPGFAQREPMLPFFMGTGLLPVSNLNGAGLGPRPVALSNIFSVSGPSQALSSIGLDAVPELWTRFNSNADP